MHTNSKKGTNQIAVRSYNEKLILQLIRESGELSKAEATRATGLSANAISMIFRSLEKDGLILRGKPNRGKIGQPSTPLRINPDARYYVALKIGRRSIELAIVNFVGEILASKETLLPFPTPTLMIEFVKNNMQELLQSIKKDQKSISSMAVAMPFELWSWIKDFDASTKEMKSWQEFDVVSALKKIVPWEITIENDATAACRAEITFGTHGEKKDWIYFYIGTFIGGGIILNGSVFPGRRGNAGGFAPMRVPEQNGGSRLINHASLIVLERKISELGGDPFCIYTNPEDWDAFEQPVNDWIIRAGRNLAYAIVSSLAVLDFEAVVIDGSMPTNIKKRLVEEVIKQLINSDSQGILIPKIEAGHIGRKARTIGAIAKLISVDYLTDQNALLQR